MKKVILLIGYCVGCFIFGLLVGYNTKRFEKNEEYVIGTVEVYKENELILVWNLRNTDKEFKHPGYSYSMKFTPGAYFSE